MSVCCRWVNRTFYPHIAQADPWQAVGEILALSDAIIGLTSEWVFVTPLTEVFAVGNSLADLVANVTVAQFAPAMAYAACFVSKPTA